MARRSLRQNAIAASHPRARLLVPASLLLLSFSVCAGQSPTQTPPLPEAPQPNLHAAQKPPDPGPCQARREAAAMAQAEAAGAPDPGGQTQVPQPAPCPPLVAPLIDWYARFLNGPQAKALTPRQKARLAASNLLDPFNAVTILGSSAIYVGANSHSAYGPGMPGFGRSVGVSFTQDMTGEFVGTFLIPSLVHQDPHYHRLPAAPIPRRIAHAVAQVVWTQADDGHGMLNYANLVGFAIDDEVGNLYVPGQQTDLTASASRYAIALAIAPADNFITEFLPDIARRIHIRVVLVQRIIDQVARTDTASQ